MGFKIQSIPATAAGCLANFGFYRDLIRRPVREAFVYLAILVLLPILLFTGSQLYELNRIMVQITESLKGHLPPRLRIEKGKVEMEGETFSFEKENEYTVQDWKAVVDLMSARRDRETDVALRKEKQGNPLSKEEEEKTSAFRLAEQRGKNALDWIDRHFPDPAAVITSQPGDALLEETPPEDAEMARLLRETAHFFNFVFLVDLTAEDPRLPPGVMGFALSRDGYTISTPLMPKKIAFSEDVSTVINDDMLDSWRKSFIWQMAPILIMIMFVVSYLITLLIVLGGSAVAGLTASLLKTRLIFRQAFAIGGYAMTPAILFVLIYLILSLFRISIGYSPLVFLLLYGFYTISAARKCCAPE
ncbi:MAG: DUF1189 family protein [PVC group bacterium]